MAEIEEILNTIEQLRLQLNKMAKEKELTDPDVISASQMLDAVLNEYQNIMKNKMSRS